MPKAGFNGERSKKRKEKGRKGRRRAKLEGEGGGEMGFWERIGPGSGAFFFYIFFINSFLLSFGKEKKKNE